MIASVDTTDQGVRGTTDQGARGGRPARDLTALKNLYRCFYEPVGCGIIVQDESGALIHANETAARILGFSTEVLEGPITLSAADLWSAVRDDGTELPYHDHPAVLALRSGHARRDITLRVRRFDGRYLWLDVDVVPIPEEGGARHVVCSFADVTAQKESLDEMRHKALHDALTGLPNRYLLRERLEQVTHATHATHGRSAGAALLLIDLDNFKEVNDTFGHACGDLLLRRIGQRLREVLRESDTVARMGGDEFAVLLANADHVSALSAARRIGAAIAGTHMIDGHAIVTEASMGIALVPAHGTEATELLRAADEAMYAAKRAGIGYAVHGTSLQTNTRPRPAAQARPLDCLVACV